MQLFQVLVYSIPAHHYIKSNFMRSEVSPMLIKFSKDSQVYVPEIVFNFRSRSRGYCMKGFRQTNYLFRIKRN